jgi:hypothetical protein
MLNQHLSKEFSFQKPAIYKIVVMGTIDEKWSDRIWGLQLSKTKDLDGKPTTTIIGKIQDQTALSGILTKIYEMHLTVISVNMLVEIENLE